MKIGHIIGTTTDSEAAPAKAPGKRPRTQTALLCQSRRRGEHTRPGCRFPRPRGKPFASGCIKRSCKVRAHHGESPNPSASQLPHPPSVFICVHLWLKPFPFFACISPCPATAVQPSPTQSNRCEADVRLKPCISGWRQLVATTPTLRTPPPQEKFPPSHSSFVIPPTPVYHIILWSIFMDNSRKQV